MAIYGSKMGRFFLHNMRTMRINAHRCASADISAWPTLERTQHVLYFLKAWDSRILNRHSRVSNVKYTNTRLHKYANTQTQSA